MFEPGNKLITTLHYILVTEKENNVMYYQPCVLTVKGVSGNKWYDTNNVFRSQSVQYYQLYHQQPIGIKEHFGLL